jgi:hypothetical protein
MPRSVVVTGDHAGGFKVSQNGKLADHHLGCCSDWGWPVVS